MKHRILGPREQDATQNIPKQIPYGPAAAFATAPGGTSENEPAARGRIPRRVLEDFFASLARQLCSSKKLILELCRLAACIGLILGVFEPARPARCQSLDSFNPGTDQYVFSLAPQTDGGILVGGDLLTLAGQQSRGIGRVNPDGTFDATFRARVLAQGGAVAVLDDGRIVLVGSNLPLPAGGGGSSLVRLNFDGGLDPSFAPTSIGGDQWQPFYCLAVQADGKIMLGGSYTVLGGQPRTNLARVNPDGSVDASFSPSAGGSLDYVNSIALQPDGKILVGGRFATLAGQVRSGLGRLNADGTLDGTLDSGGNGVVVAEVVCLTLQPDGKILAAGTFNSSAGSTGLMRFERNGALDTNFNASVADVRSIALQTDGKIIVGGWFQSLDGQPCTFIGRLNSDGSIDSSFTTIIDTNPEGFDGPSVDCLALEPDGKLLLGGWFAIVNGTQRWNLARLNNTGSASSTLNFDGSTVRWLRAGTGPEISLAVFDASTNGSDWFHLGSGQHVVGGWQLPVIGLSSNAAIRAQGIVRGGFHNASRWLVENSIGPASISRQPVSQTVNAGSVAVFDVLGAGDSPVSFRWLKGGMPIEDGSNLSGTQTSTLTLSNVLEADSAGYSVVVGNAVGTVTSVVATLTVVDPFITAQPTNQLVNVGQNATFSVSAIGTQPIRYQWSKDGTNLPGETSATLVLTNALAPDDGTVYQVAVGNQFGSLTSTSALLSVNLAVPDAFSPGADSAVNAIAVQPDGKIIVGGYFSSLGGQPRNLIGRLNPDGSLDTAFNPGASLNGRTVDALAVELDGNIVVGGDFSTLDGQQGVIRIHPDGTKDTGFTTGVGGIATEVSALAIQNDGRILVGGIFSSLGGQNRTNLGRLNQDGSVDSSFNPSPSSGVLSLAIQGDGKIVLGGFFRTLAGQPRNFLGRLNSDGSLDANFDAAADATVTSLAIQADGKVLVGGFFQNLGGFPLNDLGQIGRLNPDGIVDEGFDPGANGTVISLALEADGRVLVVGEFTRLGGQPRTYLGRLNADGSVDPTFNVAVSGAQVDCIAVDAGGNTLVGGLFDTIANQPRPQLARLGATYPAATSLTFDGSSILWLRGGSGPEVGWTQFQASTNGLSWYGLGYGKRVAGGWLLGPVTLPIGASVIAHGYVQDAGDGSGWFVDDTMTVNPLTPPIIFANDSSFGILSNSFGFDVGGVVGQAVVVEGSRDLLHWTPITTNLVDTGRFHFSDRAATSPPWRLYRARLQ